MKLSRVLPALCALLLPLAASAGSLTATWLPSATYEDLSPITALVTYRMQWGPEGQSLSKSVVTPKTTATALDLAPGRWCTQIVAIVENVEALPTNPVCVTVPAPKKKPSAATGVGVTVAP